MSTKKNVTPPINPGISLLLVTFLILCLFTFSAISLSSAKNEWERSIDYAGSTKDYYAASNKARTQISSDIKNTDKKELSYTFTINEYQNLEITVIPNQNGYNIKKWVVVPSTVWEGDNTYNLFIP